MDPLLHAPVSHADPTVSEVDGVRVLWKQAPPPLMAALVFRVGRSDETLATAGITHLVEHLAFSKLGQLRHPHNGMVDNVRTVLHASGSEDEVVAFVGNVTRALSGLPTDRLEAEARVLRTEAAGRSGGFSEELVGHRFGPVGHGLIDYVEMGLRWLGIDDVAAWAERRFTKANLVIWMSGPPPGSFGIELPEGVPEDLIVPRDIERSYPMLHPWSSQVVAFGLRTDRAAATAVGMATALRRIQTQLRHDLGLSYSVVGVRHILGGDAAHHSVAVDCLPETADDVRREVIDLMEAFAADGPTDEELAWFGDQMGRMWDDPYAVLSQLASAVDTLLTLGEQIPMDQWTARCAAVTRAEASAAIAEAWRTVTLLAPPHLDCVDGWTCCPTWSPTEAEGRTFRRSKGSREQEGARLVVGSTGVSFALDEQRTTISFDRLAGIGWSEGTRVLWASDDDGWIVVTASDWIGGVDAVGAVDAAVDPDLYFPLEGSAPQDRVPPPPTPRRGPAPYRPVKAEPRRRPWLRLGTSRD